MGLSFDALAEFVRRSCEAQGVPVKVEDVRVVSDVVTLLGGGAGGRKRSGPPAPLRSEPPDGRDSGRVESLDTGGSGSDDDVVHDGGDDGCLSGQVEIRPPAA